MKNHFVKGMYDGLPIALGYFSVSFGFGIMAVKAGLSVLAAVGISITNLTSAGQAAGVEIIAAGGTLIEMILTQLVINIRYSLMGIALSQKLDRSFTVPHRIVAAFGITDEIFAVASSKKERLVPSYMYGMIITASFGWAMGTFAGSAAGQLLPDDISGSLGILLYGMFLAIIIPPARKEKSVLAVIAAAAALSLIMRFLLPFISGGFAVIICAVAASALGALIFPVKDGEEDA